MQKFIDLILPDFDIFDIDYEDIQNVQGCLGKEMKLDGWISLILSNKECVVLKFNKGVFMNEGFVVNDQKVLKVIGNHQIGGFSYSEEEQSERVVEGIVDLDHGSRFEGLVLKEGKTGIPFGNGEMYDDDGLLIYKGIMMNWKRFGYGTSYHDNGLIEYEGYWCGDNRFGNGKVYDRYGKLVNECEWVNGIESDIEEYEGDGSEPMNIGIKHLKLTDNCVLDDWDVSWFLNLESIEIGNDCFESVQTFKIDGLNRLKTIKIGINSFTQMKNVPWYELDYTETNSTHNESKSFRILNCESLEFIQIGQYSFSDYAGEFELKNLPQLQSIQIGLIGIDSCNFWYSSFVIRGIELILNNVMIRSSKSTIHYIREICILCFLINNN